MYMKEGARFAPSNYMMSLIKLDNFLSVMFCAVGGCGSNWVVFALKKCGEGYMILTYPGLLANFYSASEPMEKLRNPAMSWWGGKVNGKIGSFYSQGN